MERVIKFLVVLLLFCSPRICAQQAIAGFGTSQRPVLFVRPVHYEGAKALAFKNPGKVSPAFWKPRELISADYYTKHFGFFCGKELQLEKLTNIRFRFRLGSLGYCNSLEGK